MAVIVEQDVVWPYAVRPKKLIRSSMKIRSRGRRSPAFSADENGGRLKKVAQIGHVKTRLLYGVSTTETGSFGQRLSFATIDCLRMTWPI